MKMKAWLSGGLWVSLVVGNVGCLDILGYKDPVLDTTPSTGGTGGTGGNTATGGTGGNGGGTAGAGGATVCEPGAKQACYSGPDGTQAVGICKGGVQECSADGGMFGACVGEVLPAQETCKDKVDENCDGFDCVLWSRTFPFDEGGLGLIRSVVAAKDGGSFIYGTFAGGFQLDSFALIGSASFDLFLAKVDSAGKVEWAGQFGGAKLEVTSGAAVDSAGNIVIAGMFGGDIAFGGNLLSGTSSNFGFPETSFFAKFSASGEHLWSRSMEVSTMGIALDKDDAVIVTGSSQHPGTDVDGITVTNGGQSDLFLAKLGADDGKALWAKGFGESGREEGLAIAVDPAGNIAVAGTFDSNLTIKGPALMNSGGPHDMFLARFDGFGNATWAAHVPGGGKETPQSLASDGTGSFYLGGSFDNSIELGGSVVATKGGLDAFLIKMTAAGQQQWSRRYGSTANESRISTSIVKSNDVLVTFGAGGPVDFAGSMLVPTGESNVVLGRLTSDGELQWNRIFGTAGTQSVEGIATTPDGGPIVGVNFTGTVNFGDGETLAKDKDIAIAKFAP